MSIREPPDALRAFRRSFNECLHRGSDAIFELTDAMLTADSAVPSPAYLSLRPAHRRGWGSHYVALDPGKLFTPPPAMHLLLRLSILRFVPSRLVGLGVWRVRVKE